MHTLLLLTLGTILASSIAITGCSRKTDTNEPVGAPETEVAGEVDATATQGSAPEEDTRAPDRSSRSPAGETTGESSTGSSVGSTENPGNEGNLICTPEWFKWVNQRVMSDQGEAIAEQYPSGLPEVGTDDWFMVVDKLTGGDGAHGPDGGSDEWCFMIQQRLGNTD